MNGTEETASTHISHMNTMTNSPLSSLTSRYVTRCRYVDRASKAQYIALKYAPILAGSVLDVGCDRRQLAGHLPASVRYIGVDMNDAADVVLNLEGECLPFKDREFDTVICADTLEHLDQIHRVFDELCRVARERVIVSLPNPLRNLLLAIGEGSNGRLKYYGLPADVPPDRHRWFFGAEEAQAFIRDRGARNGFEVEQMDVEERGSPEWIAAAKPSLAASANASEGTTWAVLIRANHPIGSPANGKPANPSGTPIPPSR
jgi:SAM-dependent methyltransferase